MTDTLATLGFKADTNDLVKADKALDNLEKSAAATESQVKQTSSAMTSMGAAATAQSTGVMKMIASLDDQVATLGMTNKELLLYRAAQQGATDADKQAIVAAVNKIEAYERMTLATRNQAVAADAMGKSVGNNRGIMQSFGYQLQDTIVQAQMGANAFMILSQQGSQMASAFGPSGAIVGALIAVAGVAGMVLAPALMDSKTEAEKLTGAMDALGESATRNENGILELTNEIKELAKQSELAANAQLQAVMIKSAEAIKLASKATAEMIDELTGAGYGLYDVADAMKELDTAFGYFGSGRSKAFTETITEIGEKFGQTGAAAEKLGLDVLKAVKAMSEAKTPEGINQAREAILRIGSEAKLSDKELASFIMTVNKFASEGITAAETAALMAKSIEDGSIATSSAKDKLTELTQQTALAREEFLYGEAAAQKLALAFELGLKSASELTPELAAQVDELVKWGNASAEAEEAVRKLAEANKLMLKNDEHEYDQITKALEDMEQASIEAQEAEMERIDKAIEQIDKYVGISEKAAERIESAFADAWMNAFDGFESVVDGMKNAFKRMLAEMAHMALTRPIMVSLGMGGMLPGGANAATGGIGGAAGGLGGLGGLFGGAAGTSSALLGSGQVGTALSFTGNLFSAGQITAGIGAALPLIAAGGAIIAAGSAISKMLGGTGNLLRGGIVGDVLLGKWKTESESLNLGLSGGDVTGSQTTTNVKKKLFKNRRETFTNAFDTSGIDDAFDAISMALSESAQMFGITGADEIIKGFSAAANIDIKGKSQEEVQAAISEWVGNTTSALVDAVFGDSLDGLQKEGEGVIDTVSRLSMNMGAVQSITKSLGLDFNLTGKAAMVASTNIVELSGGIEQLSALSSQYYQAFYTDAERQAMLMEQLTGAFSDLNIALPESRESFRAIIDGLDLTTESGQKLFASLMQLVPGLDQYLSGVEALTNASREAAEAAAQEAKAKAEALQSQGLDLQLRLYDALGNSAAALAMRRQMELDATDETLRALLLQIYAAEDAAKAQIKLKNAQEEAAEKAKELAQSAMDLQARIYEALGDSSAALALTREREIAVTDESLRALLMQVYAAEDAVTANQKLIESLTQAADAALQLQEAAEGLLDSSFGKLQQAYDAEKKAITAALDAKLAALDVESVSISEVLKAKLSALDIEQDAIEAQSKLAIDQYKEQSSAAQEYADSLKAVGDVIAGFIESSVGVAAPFKRLTQILSEAKAGLTPDSGELSSVLGAISSTGSAGYASAFDKNRDMAVAKNQAIELGKIIGNRQSDAERNIAAIEAQSTSAADYYAKQLAAIELQRVDASASADAALAAIELQRETLITGAEAQIAALDAQLAVAEKQYNALMGIDDRMLSISDALGEFTAAMAGVEASRAAAEAAASELESAQLVTLKTSDYYTAEMMKLALGQTSAESEQTQAIRDVESAVIALTETVTLKPDDRIWQPPVDAVSSKQEPIKDERVIELLNKIYEASKANAEHTSKSTSLLQEMTIGGIDVRVEA